MSLAMDLPLQPPIEPMLSNAAETLPPGDGWLFEPKWDGFRALVFRSGDDMFIQSRDKRPLDRYFPELVAALKANLPPKIILDGEIVIAGARGLEFETLQLRLHPAASRVNKLAAEIPASFVAFDVLALGDEDLTSRPQVERRARLESALTNARAPIHLTPCTRDRAVADDWFNRFEGAGLDGVMAKRDEQPYVPGKRTMLKIKHIRSADCVVAGFRWHKNGPGTLIGSLLLGLFDADGKLQHVGVTSAFTMAKRKALVEELAPLREGALDAHPWKAWAEFMESQDFTRMPGGQSRWSQGKDLSWEPLRIERVVEVKYDHLQGTRFRHAAHFLRWRFDKKPDDCTYAQLDIVLPAELAQLFGSK